MKSIFVNADRCMGCKTCEVVCALNRSSLSRRMPDAIYELIRPLARVRVDHTGDGSGFAIQCRHCEEAPCHDACPVGAIYRNSEGLVLIQEERCVGCWMCIMTCPFGAVQPFRGFKKVIKCDLCTGMEAPYCVESCPTKSLILVDEDELRKQRVNGVEKYGWVKSTSVPEKF